MSKQACIEEDKQEEKQEKVLDESQQIRASSYGLLATLLVKPPTEELLELLQGIEADKDDPKDIVNAWSMLSLAAQNNRAESIADEYFAIFIGVGRGELLPYASWYLTGFLMEKPLAHLRQRLGELGYERQDNIKEPEDHIAALSEVMSQLILDEDVDFETEQAFYNDFIDNWMGKFFQDLQQTKTTGFYQAVGQLGESIIDVEKRYFSMMV